MKSYNPENASVEVCGNTIEGFSDEIVVQKPFEINIFKNTESCDYMLSLAGTDKVYELVGSYYINKPEVCLGFYKVLEETEDCGDSIRFKLIRQGGHGGS